MKHVSIYQTIVDKLTLKQYSKMIRLTPYCSYTGGRSYLELARAAKLVSKSKDIQVLADKLIAEYRAPLRLAS